MFGRITRRESLLAGVGLAAARLIPFAPESLQAQSQSAPQSPSAAPAGHEDIQFERAVSIPEIEGLARARWLPNVDAAVAGGAADEITLRWNREAYDRLRLRPRVLVDVSKIDTRIKLFGQELPFPILLSPTGGLGIVHPEAEAGTVRGAGAAGATAIISNGATLPIDEIGRAATGHIWYQLYIRQDAGRTRELVQRAEDAGCRAVCITVDVPVWGSRDRAERFRPVRRASSARTTSSSVGEAPSTGVGQPGFRYAPITPSKITWDDVDYVRSFAKVPVLIKGVLNPDDADHAVKAGASGILVSNHGARQLDTVQATAEALPAVVDRVAGRVPVLVDGGIRRGTDVLKALALGATAVSMGRPHVFGLAVAGAAGVTRVIDILRTEFEIAMALTGRPTIASIDRSVLWSS